MKRQIKIRNVALASVSWRTKMTKTKKKKTENIKNNGYFKILINTINIYHLCEAEVWTLGFMLHVSSQVHFSLKWAKSEAEIKIWIKYD